MKTNLAADGNDGSSRHLNHIYFEDLNALMLGLSAGKVDAISIIEPTAKYITKTNEEFEMTSFEGTDELREYEYAMCLMQDNEELCKKISSAIVLMKEDGTLDKLKADLIDNEALDYSALDNQLPSFPGKDTIKVGVTGDLPPMDYTNTDGTPQGFNIALLSEISKRLEINIEIVNLTSGSRAVALTSNKVDVLFWTAVAITEGITDAEKWGDTPKNSVITEPYFDAINCGVVKKAAEK